MTKDLTPQSLGHIARGYSRARVLLTAVELDLFTILDVKPLAAEEVSRKLDSDLRATTILLDALAAMELLEKKNNLYITPHELSPLLDSNSSETIIPGLLHSAHLWRTWSHLTDIVKEGGPAGVHDDGKEDRNEAFIGAMHVRARKDAGELVRDIDPGEARALIDVGGASGSYTAAFLDACPDMKATIFDLPDVVPMARKRMNEEGLADRVNIVAGNYNRDPLPGGHDLALLSAIIHQNSHDQNEALYRKVHDALVPGGRIVIRDWVMNPDRTKPPSGALFAINMLVNTDGGNSYTLDEIEDGLTSAGFEKISLIKDDEGGSLLEGFKP